MHVILLAFRVHGWLVAGLVLCGLLLAGAVSSEEGTVSEGCAAVGNKYPPFDFTAHQPTYAEANLALARASTGSLVDDERFAADFIETGKNGERLVAPFLPARLFKALAYVESVWSQATLDTPRGTSGPVILSVSCAYGMTQILSGMQHTKNDGSQPTEVQTLIGSDYRYNAAQGMTELVEKWNYTPYRTSTIAFPQVGNRLPQFFESWYFAVWAYNGMSTRNHPANPDMPWPRPRYNSPEYNTGSGCKGFHCYPYQELVLDLVTYPPSPAGFRLWPSQRTTLPDRNLFVNRGPIWPPPDIPLPRPAHVDRLRDGTPQLSVGRNIIAIDLKAGQRVPLAVVPVANDGKGPMGWRASVKLLDRPAARWVSARQSRLIDDGFVALSFDPKKLPPGLYRAQLTVDAPLSTRSPRTIPIVLKVTERRIFIPGLSRR